MSDRLTFVLHLLGLGTYFGATLYVLLAVLPAARRLPDTAARQTYLATHFRVYDPLVIAALGIQVMTGAFSLTAYKASLMGDFWAQVGERLVWKLGLVFLLVMVVTYTAFGLGHRIVRYEQWNEVMEDKILAGIQGRLSAPLALGLVLTVVIVWISVARGG